MDEMLSDLRAFAAVPAPSGRETSLAQVVRERWEELEAPTVETDPLGNLHVTLGSGGVHIALVAHLDEVGFVVRRITDQGFVLLTRLGGIPERVLASQELIVLARGAEIPGIIGTWPHHYTPDDAKRRVPTIDEMYLDIGASSAMEVADRFGVRVGDYAVYARSFRTRGEQVVSNALDDRAGLAAVTSVLAHLAGGELPGRVSLIASVQEEFSLRGLVPTVRALDPDVLVAVDVSPATDTPETQGHASDIRLGAGPVAHLQSFHGRGTLAGVLPPAWLVDAVDETAEAAGIGLQRGTFYGGLTDASFAQLEGSGMAAIELGVAVRYTHTPREVGHLGDLRGLVDLLVGLCTTSGLSAGRRDR